MKKFLNGLNLVLIGVIVSSLSFISCSKDDDITISDPASAVSGTYIGTGKLTDGNIGGLDYESYLGMKMVVSKSSNEYVILTPYEADGSSFFGSGGGDVFKITKTASGDYILSSSNYPKAVVSISKNGYLDYYYPYVAVNSVSGYALSFSGNKEK